MKIQNRIGDRCIGSGYVKKESIEIVSRSSFEIPNEDLKVGYVTNVNFKTNVTHRTRGMPTKTQKTWTMVRTVVLVVLVHLMRTAPYVIVHVRIMFKR